MKTLSVQRVQSENWIVLQLVLKEWVTCGWSALMRADAYLLQMLLLTVSGWVNRNQQDVIAYQCGRA